MHNILTCKDCKKGLADVWMTKDADLEYDYVALCPFCNSESETKTIIGLVHIGSIQGTRLKDIQITEDSSKAIIHLEKE